MNAPDPREHVHLTKIDKRGDHYEVRGKVDGADTVVHIPAPSIEERNRKDAEALMRRSLYGTAQSAGELRSSEPKG